MSASSWPLRVAVSVAGLVVLTALAFGLSACSADEEPTASASASASLPTALATVAAATPQKAFDRYVDERLSEILYPNFPGAKWDSRRFGPATDSSATILLTVRFKMGEDSAAGDSWATYSVTRDELTGPWRISRISPPAQRMLPSPMWTVGP
jgi:hypothetical protein